MSGKNVRITPETYCSNGDIYNYEIHPKSPKHLERYFGLPPVVDFCSQVEAKPQPARLLDLGSGVGVESAVLMNTLPFAEVFSVDISTEGSQKCKDLGLNHVQADVEGLSFSPESFDAIHCKDVLVHIPDKESFLLGVARVLKHCGLLLLVSSRKAWTEIVQFEWTPEQVISAAQRQGLELESMNVKNLRTEDWYNRPRDRVFLMFKKK